VWTEKKAPPRRRFETTPFQLSLIIRWSLVRVQVGAHHSDWFYDPTETPGRYFLINGMDRYSTFGYQDMDAFAVLGLRCTPDPERQLQSVRLIRMASENSTQTVLSLMGATGVRSTTN
jgi:hypothetical protein